MSGFTCITCRLIFTDIQSQHDHYRTAWHCFNLKRKVTGLAPIPEDVFNEKVEALKTEKQNALLNQKQKKINSKKQHKRRKEKQRRKYDRALADSTTTVVSSTIHEPDSEDIISEQTDNMSIINEHEMSEEEMIAERLRTAKPIPVIECLFNGKQSTNLEKNLEYMRSKFGLFIPEVECLTDLEGLISYLGEKIGVGFTCIYCQKSFHSLPAVRNHMIDKSHCKIDFYGKEEEFSDYYDWSRSPYLTTYETTEEIKDEQGREIVINNLEALPISTAKMDEDSGELILKSGVTIGHRSLQVYYRQRHRPQDSRSSVLINQLVRQYRQFGYIEQGHQEVDRKARTTIDKYHLKLQLSQNKTPTFMRHNTHMC